jgi:uncharacterized secreted protein with C-terminal beta-propeller domain
MNQAINKRHSNGIGARRRRRWAAVTAGSLLLFGGPTLIPNASAASKSTAARAARAATWARFSSCDKFLAYVRPEAIKLVGPFGLGGQFFQATPATASAGPGVTVRPAAAPAAASEATASGAAAAPNTSGTNTQEVGVDEGDMTETDGRFVYVARVRTVDVVDTKGDPANPSARTANVVGSVSLPANSQQSQLILSGTRLAVITSVFDSVGPSTIVTVYDVSNPPTPQFITRRHLEGQAVSARSVDGRVRLVVQTNLGTRLGPQFVQPTSQNTRDLDLAKAKNLQVIRSAPIGDWLPRTFSEDATGGTGPLSQALSCGEIGRPSEFSGLAITWVATISLDPAQSGARIEGSAGVVGSGSTVYASTQTLYVATNSIAALLARSGTAPRQIKPQTEIHSFTLGTQDGARWVASGSVPGFLLNQFAMSELDNVLRVATTETGGGFGGETSSTVRTMQRSGRSLVQLGQVGGLGRNERIFGVRFIGTQGYVVTFRQTDPLYVIDLRNPRDPRLAGELKIPGYSAYLHPIGDGKLIGIGQDADANGRRLGTQLAVFDVSNPAEPKRISQLTLGGWTEAEYNHLAFLWWSPTRDAVLPMTPGFSGIPDATTGSIRTPAPAGASILRIGTGLDGAITNRGSVLHTTENQPPAAKPVTPPQGDVGIPRPPQFFSQYPVRRSMIVDGALVTVSDLGVLVSNLDTLAPTAWRLWT